METVMNNEVVAVPSPSSGGGKNLLTGYGSQNQGWMSEILDIYPTVHYTQPAQSQLIALC